MAKPASRLNYGIGGEFEEGGEVSFIDLGDSALVLPGGIDQAKAELRRVLGERYETGLEDINDPDLVDQ